MIKFKLFATAAVTVAMIVSAAPSALGQTSEEPDLIEITGSYSYAGNPDAGELSDLAPGHTRRVGQTWAFRSREVSDPRLDGDVLFTWVNDTHPGLDYIVRVGRLETEDGAWVQEPIWMIDGATHPIDTVWVGEDAYEGLLLVAEWTFTGNGFTFDGHIVESDLPPTPVAVSPSE